MWVDIQAATLPLMIKVILSPGVKCDRLKVKVNPTRPHLSFTCKDFKHRLFQDTVNFNEINKHQFQ